MSKVFIIVTICIFAIPAMFRYDVGIDLVLEYLLKILQTCLQELACIVLAMIILVCL